MDSLKLFAETLTDGGDAVFLEHPLLVVQEVEGRHDGQVVQLVGSHHGMVGGDGPVGGHILQRGTPVVVVLFGVDRQDGEPLLGDSLVDDGISAQPCYRGAAVVAVGVVEQQQRHAVGSRLAKQMARAVGRDIAEVASHVANAVARDALQRYQGIDRRVGGGQIVACLADEIAIGGRSGIQHAYPLVDSYFAALLRGVLRQPQEVDERLFSVVGPEQGGVVEVVAVPIACRGIVAACSSVGDGVRHRRHRIALCRQRQCRHSDEHRQQPSSAYGYVLSHSLRLPMVTFVAPVTSALFPPP